MATPLQTLKAAEGTILRGRDGNQKPLSLLPPLTDEEFRRFEASIPCPVPEEARELLQYSRGFDGPSLLRAPHRMLDRIDVSGPDGGFGLEEIFPHALSIAGDGCGNFWVIDLNSGSTSWGPIFYACHDAPVIVYQTDSLAHFIQEVLRGWNPPWETEIRAVHEKFSYQVWRTNPGVLSFEECTESKDEDLRPFARSLDASYEFIDLRAARLGDGFSWGRYGRGFVVKRYGEKRLFANQIKSKWQRFKNAFK